MNHKALEQGERDGYDPAAFGVAKGLLRWVVDVKSGVGGEIVG